MILRIDCCIYYRTLVFIVISLIVCAVTKEKNQNGILAIIISNNILDKMALNIPGSYFFIKIRLTRPIKAGNTTLKP